MSVWGGIGEGIAQGLKERMDREDQERRERTAQFNADRQFRLAQEQAERAQANADRTFAAGREDAARAQSNADRAFTEGVRRADMAQANADRTFAANEEQRGIENERADYRLAMDAESQDWKNKLNSEQYRSFQLANEKLDSERRERQRKEEAVAQTGVRQFVLAANQMLNHGAGQKGTFTVEGNQIEGTLLNGEEFERIFGKDNPLLTDQKNGINGLILTKLGGKDVIYQLKNDGRAVPVDTDGLYKMAEGAYDKSFADMTFGSIEAKRQMGMLQEQERFKTNEAIRRDNASGLVGRRNVDALQSILKAANEGTLELNDAQKKMISDMIPQLTSFYSNANANANAGAGAGRVQTAEDAARARAALEQKKAAQKRITAPTAQKSVDQKTESKKVEKKSVEPQKKSADTSIQPKKEMVDERRRKEAYERRKASDRKEFEAVKKDDEEWGAGEYKVPQNKRGLYSKEMWKEIVDKRKARTKLLGTGPKPVKSTFLGV